jgi:NAD(P)H-hydrate repair Nnr-like enzyme with NAD(P)H-hydrate epimerase domain
MVKLSFKFQMSLLIVTIIAVVAVVALQVDKANKQAQFTQMKAIQTMDYGFQAITEKAMSPETGAFMIDSLIGISGNTPDGGEYAVSVVKDTISADSIEIKIVSEGIFGGEVRSQVKKMLLVSTDSINWEISD